MTRAERRGRTYATAPLTSVDQRLRRATTVVAIVAAVLVAALGVLYLAGGSLGGFDGRAAPWDGLRQPWYAIALVIDFCGEPVGSTILTAAVVVICLVLRRIRMAVLTVAAICLTVGMTTVLKPVVGRTIHGDYLSFPSGHTAFATAFALIVTLLVIDVRGLGGRGGLVLGLALVIPAGAAEGWAQVMLSAHYPTDTLGGFCAALAIVPAITWLVCRQAPRSGSR